MKKGARKTNPEITNIHRQRALYYMAVCAAECANDLRNDEGFRLACAELHGELARRGDAMDTKRRA